MSWRSSTRGVYPVVLLGLASLIAKLKVARVAQETVLVCLSRLSGACFATWHALLVLYVAAVHISCMQRYM